MYLHLELFIKWFYFINIVRYKNKNKLLIYVCIRMNIDSNLVYCQRK